MKKRIIAAVAVCLVLAVALTAGILLRPQTTARAEEPKAAVTDWSDKIASIKREPSIYSNYPNLIDEPDAMTEAYHLGFVSAPFFVEANLQWEHEDSQAAFLVSAASLLLHLRSIPGALNPYGPSDGVSSDADAYLPHWYARQLLAFVKDAPDAVESICQSDRPMEEKAAALQAYGLLAVPVLQRHVERGETEWNDLIANLTMAALSEEEKIACLTDTLYLRDPSPDQRMADLYALRQERLAGTSLPDGWYDSHREEWDLFTAKWQELIDKYGI